MAQARTGSGGRRMWMAIVMALVAVVAALLIATFAFGAFGIRDSYRAPEGGGGAYPGQPAPSNGTGY